MTDTTTTAARLTPAERAELSIADEQIWQAKKSLIIVGCKDLTPDERADLDRANDLLNKVQRSLQKRRERGEGE